MKNVLFAIAILAALCLPLSAQGPDYPYSVTLAFVASIPGPGNTITGYNMYRSPFSTTTGCGSFSRLNSTPFTATTFTDSNPPENHYCYAATAVDGTGAESGYSNMDKNIVIPPPPPTSLGATIATGSTTAKFHWVASAGTGVNKNKLYCGPKNGGPYTLASSSTPPATQIVLANLKSGAHYCIVTALKSAEESGKSNQAIARVQ